MGENEAKATPKKSGWIIMTVAVSLLILYTLYHVLFGLSGGVETTYAGLVTDGRAVILEGVVFRDEATIDTQYTGDLYPHLYNGERVSAGALAAEIYSQATGADIQDRQDELLGRLEILKKSNIRGLISVTDIEGLNAEINDLHSQYMLAISKGDNFRAASLEGELLVAMNKLKICTGEVKNYDAEIEETERELNDLYNALKGEKEYVYSDRSAYFYHSCDGYEEVLTSNTLEALDTVGISSLINEVKNTPIKVDAKRCKFVYDHVWRIATLCESDVAELLEIGNSYDVTLYDYRQRSLTFTLESIGEEKEGSVMLVFSCSQMPEGFEFARYQSFRIDVSTVKGYRVPQSALVTLTDENNEERVGVYVLEGSEVHFKAVTVLAQGSGYYICAEQSAHGDGKEGYLSQGEQIILDPEGMYDGRVLSR